MSDFLVIPAIDIHNGKCVRLRQGKFSEETVYADDPVQMARQWESAGAKCLHVVDLNGALEGRPVNTALIVKIAAAVRIPVQAGGGLRSAEQIQSLLAGGLRRVIIGSAACQSEETLAGLIAKFKSALAAGIDASQGLVQTRGWTKPTSLKAVDLAARLAQMGMTTLIYTDIKRDGMLAGPDLAGIIDLCRRVNCAVIASGGVASLGDIINLRSLALPNLAGVIVGKALYEGKITLKDIAADGGAE